MMRDRHQYDVAILGGGPGGYVSAIRASQLGAKVAIIEKNKLGGTCTNKGCIPTKALLNIGEIIQNTYKLKQYGIFIDDSKFDFSNIMIEANNISEKISQHVENLMLKNDVEIIKGNGRLLDNKTIEIFNDTGNKIVVESSDIIIATGSSPMTPSIPGVNDEKVMTTDDILEYYEKPNSISIIGAGAIGLEWGTIQNNFGAKVSIIEMMPKILPKEEEEITDYLNNLLIEEDINIYTGTKVNKIQRSNDLISLHLDGGKVIDSDIILLACGRTPNINKIGLEGLVNFYKGRIVVDNHMRTKTKNIYAIGDVVGKWMLAHVAMKEGLVAGENATGGNIMINYNSIPRCVYTNPEVAFVGLSYKEAVEQSHSDVETAYYPIRANGRAMTMQKSKGFIKMIFEKQYGEILGAQIIAPYASEIIEEICLAINLQATLEDLIDTVHAHPTLSEIIREVAMRGAKRELHI